MTLKAILFDYGDTLITTQLDWNQVLRENIGNLLGALRKTFPALDAIQVVRDFLFFRAVGKQRAVEEWIETTAEESLAKALSLQHLAALEPWLIEQVLDAYFAPEERHYEVINGVPEMLTRLRATQLKLGLLSNATSGRLIRRSLAAAGLSSYFDQVLISADLGICKPDPALFTHILKALGAEPASAIMVGDLLNTDIAGAKTLGMRSVLVNFLDYPIAIPSLGPQPTAIVNHPDEIVALVLDWMKTDTAPHNSQ